MKLLIKNILVGIAVIPLFFHIIILCVNVLRGNVEIRDDISIINLENLLNITFFLHLFI